MGASFLQSRGWADIQERDGHKVHLISFGSEECFVYRHLLPLGFYYYYLPRPEIRHEEVFVEALKNFAHLTKAIFLRIESEKELRIKDKGLRIGEAPNLQPRETTIINLEATNEELLSLMHPKTRYNIRVAEKHGVVVERRIGGDATDDFYKLLAETAGRDKFHLHPKSHYQNLLFSNSHELENSLFFAIYQNQIAAVAMVNFYAGTATYLHGASDYALRHVMAPYLLHWRIIEEARKWGMARYDLWGIDEMRWPGVTRFKRGFGGAEKHYPNAVDIVFRPVSYMLYTVARRMYG